MYLHIHLFDIERTRKISHSSVGMWMHNLVTRTEASVGAGKGGTKSRKSQLGGPGDGRPNSAGRPGDGSERGANTRTEKNADFLGTVLVK